MQTNPVQLKNNLKQIGLALIMHHDTLGSFPAGWKANADAGVPGWGWMSQSLQFIEQGNLYNQINYSDRISSLSHSQVRTQNLPFMICPSSPTASDPIVKLTEGNYEDPFGPLGSPDWRSARSVENSTETLSPIVKLLR